MRSQEIKIRNLSFSEGKPKSIRVKPMKALFACIVIGTVFIFQKNLLTATGLALVLLGLFGIVLMPDRTLAQFTPENLILYNSRNRDSCMLIYWDEIVNWQYEWHAMSDLLVVTLIDGSTQTAEMYSKLSVARLMRLYAGNKEKKNNRG